MQYMLLIYGDEAAMPGPTDSDTYRMAPAYTAYAQAMSEAGVLVGGDRLRPTAAATTVRMVGGKTQVLDGPYAETKEQLGGYFLIEAPHLDTALAWAQRCPGAAHGAIEIRPIWPAERP